MSRYVDDRQVIDEPILIQDELYIRDYDKCVLCYKCVSACDDDAQHTFAISVAGRGFDNRISTEFDATLPDSACVYCGNCVAVCPTGALQFKSEFDLRQADNWREEEQTVTQTVCSYCGDVRAALPTCPSVRPWIASFEKDEVVDQLRPFDTDSFEGSREQLEADGRGCP